MKRANLWNREEIISGKHLVPPQVTKRVHEQRVEGALDARSARPGLGWAGGVGGGPQGRLHCEPRAHPSPGVEAGPAALRTLRKTRPTERTTLTLRSPRTRGTETWTLNTLLDAVRDVGRAGVPQRGWRQEYARGPRSQPRACGPGRQPQAHFLSPALLSNFHRYRFTSGGLVQGRHRAPGRSGGVLVGLGLCSSK